MRGPVDPVAGQPEAGTPDDCARACAHLRSLNCPEAASTPGPDGVIGTADDSSCEAVCNEVEQSNYVTLNSRCVATIATCAEISSCGWSAE